MATKHKTNLTAWGRFAARIAELTAPVIYEFVIGKVREEMVGLTAQVWSQAEELAAKGRQIDIKLAEIAAREESLNKAVEDAKSALGTFALTTEDEAHIRERVGQILAKIKTALGVSDGPSPV